MIKSIDARGMQCPLPVIQTKQALKDMNGGTLEVIVDNEIAVQNLLKMARQMKLTDTFEKISEDYYVVRVDLADEAGEDEILQIENVRQNETLSMTDYHEAAVVVLSKDHMGEGDEQLGKALMKGFVYALTELETLPQNIVLYNSGAKLSVEGSDSLEDLKLLEEQGVEIVTCGTCLNFYGISDQLSVGSVTNMYAIAEIMMTASKIIKP